MSPWLSELPKFSVAVLVVCKGQLTYEFKRAIDFAFGTIEKEVITRLLIENHYRAWSLLLNDDAWRVQL
jgi:hypothetical protein